MQTLEKLYDKFYEPSRQPFFQNLIDESHQTLIQNLSKADRKLVLRIIDSKDEISCNHTIESFICGFNLAMEILTELKNYKKGNSFSDDEMELPFAMEETNEHN